MRTIVLFGPKGGTGRTTATLLLAMAALVLGRRVLLLDASDAAACARKGEQAPLEEWAARVLAREPALPLAAVAVRNFNGLHDALRGALLAWQARLTKAAQPGSVLRAARETRRRAAAAPVLPPFTPDLVLVDTAAKPDDRARFALGVAHAVIVPVTGPTEARLLQAPLRREFDLAWPSPDPAPPVLAVGCGLGVEDEGGCDGAEAVALMREGHLARAGRLRLLAAGLPRAPELLKRLWKGELPLVSLRRAGDARTRGAVDDRASSEPVQGRADHFALLADLVAACLVAAEVELAARAHGRGTHQGARVATVA